MLFITLEIQPTKLISTEALLSSECISALLKLLIENNLHVKRLWCLKKLCVFLISGNSPGLSPDVVIKTTVFFQMIRTILEFLITLSRNHELNIMLKM